MASGERRVYYFDYGYNEGKHESVLFKTQAWTGERVEVKASDARVFLNEHAKLGQHVFMVTVPENLTGDVWRIIQLPSSTSPIYVFQLEGTLSCSEGMLVIVHYGGAQGRYPGL